MPFGAACVQFCGVALFLLLPNQVTTFEGFNVCLRVSLPVLAINSA